MHIHASVVVQSRTRPDATGSASSGGCDFTATATLLLTLSSMDR